MEVVTHGVSCERSAACSYIGGKASIRARVCFGKVVLLRFFVGYVG